jgi:hypothetical protein
MADLVQNLFHLFGPNKWLRILIVDSNKFLDGLGQFRHAFKGTAPDSFARDFSKPPLHQI